LHMDDLKLLGRKVRKASNVLDPLDELFSVNGLHLQVRSQIVCFVERASRNMHVMKPTWCTICIQFIQSPNLYIFRSYSCPSSWGSIVHVQQIARVVSPKHVEVSDVFILVQLNVQFSWKVYSLNMFRKSQRPSSGTQM
jgi:hypothetical protein